MHVNELPRRQYSQGSNVKRLVYNARDENISKRPRVDFDGPRQDTWAQTKDVDGIMIERLLLPKLPLPRSGT